MPRRNPIPPSHDAPASETSETESASLDAIRTQPDLLRRMAPMVASGEMPLPLNWPPDQLRCLLDEVHRLRRRRLVDVIARAIANDIRRQRQKEPKNAP